LLLNGLESSHTLLNEFIKAHTTCYPGDTGLPFTSHERKLHIEVQLTSFEWDRLQNGMLILHLQFPPFSHNSDPKALRSAAQVVQSRLTRGVPPSFGHVSVRLVEYGIARLVDRNNGQIIEPLAFVSFLKWLQTQEHHKIGTNIGTRSAYSDSRGLAYEELVIIYLRRTLQYPMRLDTIFDFHGTAPSWAHGLAQIVGHLGRTSVPVDVLGEAPLNPGLGEIYFAETPEDIIHWLDCANDTPPILLPTHLFGPDIMVRMEVETVSPSNETLTMEVIGMGQDKSKTVGNTVSLNAGTMSEALASLNEDHWFQKMKMDNPNRRQKLVDALRNRNILRFVAGYPLPPNLNLRAPSVRQAISALGANAPLATLNLHSFEAEFLTDHEFRDVLAIMRSAVPHKRKASDTNG